MYELEQLIAGRIDASRATNLMRLASAFDLHQATMYQQRINELYMTGDNQDYGALTDLTVGILQDQAIALLQQMRIDLDFDVVREAMLPELIECLLFLPADDDQDIIDALEILDSPEEALAEILGARTSYDQEAWLPILLSVTTETINQIKVTLSRNVDEVVVPVKERAKVLNAINNYIAKTGYTGVTLEAMAAGIEPGTSLRTMIQHCQADLQERIDKGELKELVDDLITLAMLAKIPMDSVADEVRHQLESIVFDISLLMKANRHLDARAGNAEVFGE